MSLILQCARAMRQVISRPGHSRSAACAHLSFALAATALAAFSPATRAATSAVPVVGAIDHTYVDTPVHQTQTAFSTTLETISGDQVVSRATFSVPFADPQVQ